MVAVTCACLLCPDARRIGSNRVVYPTPIHLLFRWGFPKPIERNKRTAHCTARAPRARFCFVFYALFGRFSVWQGYGGLRAGGGGGIAVWGVKSNCKKVRKNCGKIAENCGKIAEKLRINCDVVSGPPESSRRNGGNLVHGMY